jgi:hypothetical protein
MQYNRLNPILVLNIYNYIIYINLFLNIQNIIYINLFLNIQKMHMNYKTCLLLSCIYFLDIQTAKFYVLKLDIHFPTT